MNPILIGVDLAKHSFAVCEVNHTGRVLRRHEFKRQAFCAYLAHLPAGTRVAMKACGGAHYWGRRCYQYGLVPRVMAAQFVKPFRKSRSAKNDRNDAEAIATAPLGNSSARTNALPHARLTSKRMPATTSVVSVFVTY